MPAMRIPALNVKAPVRKPAPAPPLAKTKPPVRAKGAVVVKGMPPGGKPAPKFGGDRTVGGAGKKGGGGLIMAKPTLGPVTRRTSNTRYRST